MKTKQTTETAATSTAATTEPPVATTQALGAPATARATRKATRATKTPRAASKATAKAPGKAKTAKKPAGKPATAATPREGSKKAAVLAMISRAKGAAAAEIMKATGWQAHTVRGFLSILRSKGTKMESFTTPAGARTYRAT